MTSVRNNRIARRQTERGHLPGLLLVVCGVVTLCAADQSARENPFPLSAKTLPRVGVELFAKQIRPILETQCVECHGGKATKHGLDLTTREGLLRGGDGGPAIVPGKATESLLYRRITHADEPGMPFKRDKLS